ncbi:hypothetical protein NDU88_006556, partial [Pleurodeles waltl]
GVASPIYSESGITVRHNCYGRNARCNKITLT